MSQILALLLVLLSLSISASEAVGSRSTHGVIINNNRVNVPDAAVNLNVTNFDAELRDTPAAYAIVEFYAHWCPACRNYKPHYEKVARLFNGPDAVHPGVILMTRVDCALKINTNLCDNFSVVHYPMLFWGPSLKFVSGGWKPRQEKSEIHIIDDGRTTERLLNWINKEMGSSFGLDDEHRSSNASEQVLHTAA